MWLKQYHIIKNKRSKNFGKEKFTTAPTPVSLDLSVYNLTWTLFFINDKIYKINCIYQVAHGGPRKYIW